MAKTAIDRPVQQSVLDRLTDLYQGPDDDERARDGAEPDRALLAARRRTMRELSVQALKDALRRDLEWLLNTRRTPAAAPEELGELTHSVYNYGLPDMTALSRTSPRDRERLLRQVEEAIATFEPRLSGVRVSLAETGSRQEGTEATRDVRFLIEGLLRLDPAPERVVFDTVLDTPRGEYQVRAPRGA